MKWLDRLALGALVAGVAMAAAFGAMKLWQRYGGAGEDPLLAYVPADTLVFLGGTEPFPSGRFLEHFAVSGQGLSPRQLAELEAETGDAPEGVKLLLALLVEAQRLDGNSLLTQLGLPESGRSAFYTIGAAPVLRVELAEPAALEGFLQRVEQRANVRGEQVSFRGQRYRRYPLLPAGAQTRPVYLALGVREGIATVLLEGEGLGGDALRALAFGLERPERSLAQSGQLQALMDAHGYLPASLGYISHREIMRGLVEPEGNRLSALITQALAGSDHPGLEWLRQARGEGCRQDLMAMAELWPQTSLGYTELEFGEQARAEFQMVVESRDPAAMAVLQALRGHIPPHANDAEDIGLLSMALGLDVSAVPGALQKGWQRMVDARFRCPALQRMQLAAREQNPAMVGAMLGMVSSIKGLSLAVRDLELELGEGSPMPRLRKASGLLTLSADNPAVLLGMAAGFLPPLAELTVPEDGTPVALPLPLELGVTPMVALAGSHVVVFLGGEQLPTVQAMQAQPIAANGFFSASLDYARYGRLGKQVMASPALLGAPGMDELGQMLDELTRSRLKVVMDMDFQPEGLVLRTRMRSAAR